MSDGSEAGEVAVHTKHYLDVVEKYRDDRFRSYHYHHLTINFAIEGPTDPIKLQAAVAKLSAANPALRSYYTRKNAEWTQAFVPPDQVGAFSHEKFPDPNLDWQKTARAAVDKLNDEPLDVTRPPPFKVVLLEFASISVVLTKWHHIVCDGWSILVALNQLLGFYNAEMAGVEAPIPAMSAADYLAMARQQNAWLNSTDGADKLKWWRTYLQSHTFLKNPLDERPQGFLGVCSDQLTLEQSAALLKLAETEGYHSSYFVHAAFLKALQPVVDSDDILVTFVKANRDQATGGIIANFADWVMVRHQLKGEPSLRKIAPQAQKDVNEAKNQYLPYWHIVHELSPSQYFKDFGITPYSFDFVPPLQPKVDIGAPIKFAFLHQLDAIPFRLVATDIFCRMSMHTYEGDPHPRIHLDLIHHSGYVPRDKVQSVLDVMKREIASELNLL